jgi:hypothetical protein
MNYISIDQIVNRVKSRLYSLDEASLIDEVSLITWSKWMIDRLGMGLSIEKEEIIDIENYQCLLPENFHLLWVVHKCNECNTNGSKVRYYLNSRPITVYSDNILDTICYDKCEIVRTKEYVTQKMYIEQTETPIERQFCERSLLSLDKKVKKNRCHTKCENLYSKEKDHFNFDNKKMYFNFEEGTIHLQYYAYAQDEEGYPMIPDDQYVIKAIEDYLTYEIFLQLYYNAEGDFAQRMQKAEQEHVKSMQEALFNQKLPTFQRMVKYAEELPQSLEIFNLASNADRISSSDKRYINRHQPITRYW